MYGGVDNFFPFLKNLSPILVLSI